MSIAERGASVKPRTEQLTMPKTAKAVSAHMKKWSKRIKERVSQGEPFIVADVFTPHELFEAMDIPWVLSIFLDWYYPDLVADKGKENYRDIIAEADYDLLGECGRCGERMAQLGKLPKFTAMVSAEGDCSGAQKAVQLWCREYDVPLFTLEGTASTPYYDRYPRWWERIKDHWDEIIEPHRLDYRVEELKELIKFLEVTTGKTLSQTKLIEVMELVNEQQEFWRKTRDLIAETVPSPVGVYDSLYTYAAQWHRGTPEGCDMVKIFYEETKERVDNGEAVCPNEKIRLQWVKSAFYTNPDFYRYFEDKYGAVFVCSWYLSPGADCYARSLLNDPLRALAGRHLFLGLYAGPEWDLKEAKLHKVDGAVMMTANCPSGGVARKMHKMAYEAAGIPMCLIDSSWDEKTMRSEVCNFIETRLS